MKTIEITDEMYNSLMDISKELNTQNHRVTAMPYFFQIQTDEWNYVSEGRGEQVWFLDGNILETKKEIKEAIINYKEWNYFDKDKINKLYSKLSEYDKDNILEEAGCEQVNRELIHNYKNAFFTEKACKEHIAKNRYHYNNPTDYLQYAFRNPEMELVMQFLCELSGGKLHK